MPLKVYAVKMGVGITGYFITSLPHDNKKPKKQRSFVRLLWRTKCSVKEYKRVGWNNEMPLVVFCTGRRIPDDSSRLGGKKQREEKVWYVWVIRFNKLFW